MAGRGRYNSRSGSRSVSHSPRRYSRSRSRSPRRRYRSPPKRNYRDSPNRDNFRSRSPQPQRERGNYRGAGQTENFQMDSTENQDHQIYVARFARRTGDSELKRAFEKFGPIEKVDLKDGRGFGFIYFRNKRDAEDAIDEMNGRCLPHSDERLVVERAGLKSRRTRDREARRRSTSRGGRRQGLGGPEVCYNCNREGHFARECREKINMQNIQNRQFRERGGRQRDADTDRKISEGRCFICNQKGHKKIDCPERVGGRDYDNRGPRRRYQHDHQFNQEGRDQHDRRTSRSPFSGSRSRERGFGQGAVNRQRSNTPSNSNVKRQRSGSQHSRSRSHSREKREFSDTGSRHSGRGQQANDEERKKSDNKKDERRMERRSYSRSISPRGSRGRDLRRDIGRITNNHRSESRGSSGGYGRQRKQRSNGKRSQSGSGSRRKEKGRDAYNDENRHQQRHPGNDIGFENQRIKGFEDDTEAQTANMTNAPSKNGSKDLHQHQKHQIYKKDDDYAANDHQKDNSALGEEQS